MELVLFVTIIVKIVTKQDHVQFVQLTEHTEPLQLQFQQMEHLPFMIAHVMMDIMMMVPITQYVNHVCGNVPLVTTPIPVLPVSKM